MKKYSEIFILLMLVSYLCSSSNAFKSYCRTQRVLSTNNIIPSRRTRQSESRIRFSPFPLDFGSELVTSVNAWSVESVDSADLASKLFSVSLFPYLFFLYFLGKDEVETPKLANFGFRFLLVFVFATIPAGIASKVLYNDILANVDWLHGLSESLLTITNLFIVTGFRQAMLNGKSDKNERAFTLHSSILSVFLVFNYASSHFLASAAHVEPSNALSFPTWIIHTSSVLEWLVAMALVWQYAEYSGKSKWKGLTWGMLPLQASGFCACTFHFFFNQPAYYSLVALQAFLTCVGNTTMGIAAWRLFKQTEMSEILQSQEVYSTKTTQKKPPTV